MMSIWWPLWQYDCHLQNEKRWPCCVFIPHSSLLIFNFVPYLLQTLNLVFESHNVHQCGIRNMFVTNMIRFLQILQIGYLGNEQIQTRLIMDFHFLILILIFLGHSPHSQWSYYGQLGTKGLRSSPLKYKNRKGNIFSALKKVM